MDNETNILFVGIGAAGNKAVINLIEKGIIDEEDSLLYNSALTDIPEPYRKNAIKFSQLDGCAKERSAAKRIALDRLKEENMLRENMILIGKILNGGYKKVTIVTSIEGGTGSGATPIFVNFINRMVAGIFIEVYAFKGFEKDTRGLLNSIEFLMEIPEQCSLQIICNDKFLKEAKGNELTAQKLANDELAKKVRISLGQLLDINGIYNSNNNIDPSELHKLTSAYNGYSIIECIPVTDKIKSIDEYDDLILEMIHSTKSIEAETASAKTIGVIANLEESSRNNVDTFHKVLKKEFAPEIFDVFDQFYTDPDSEQFIAIIVCGLNMPYNLLNDMKKRYQERSSKIDKSEDKFFTDRMTVKGDIEDVKFDTMGGLVNNDKPRLIDSGFDSFMNEYKAKPKKTIKNNKTLIEPVNESDY